MNRVKRLQQTTVGGQNTASFRCSGAPLRLNFQKSLFGFVIKLVYAWLFTNSGGAGFTTS